MNQWDISSRVGEISSELIWDTGGFLILQLLDLIIDSFNGGLAVNNGTWEGTEHSYVLETGG